MDTILTKGNVGSLEMDRELRAPRLQYIKMNCKKDSKQSSSVDVVSKVLNPFYSMILSGGVDAPQFDPYANSFQGQKNEDGCLIGTACPVAMKDLQEDNLLGVNAIDGIL